MARMAKLRRQAAKVPGKGEIRTPTEFYEKVCWKSLLGRLRRR
jgi:hypothetical protein